MARIPYRDPASAPEDVRKLLDALPPLNIFRMLGHAETLARGFAQLGGAILGRAALDPRLRELVILRVGTRSPAPYEWQQHVPIARATGATEAEIAAIARDTPDAPSFGARELAILRLTDELLATPRASDATLAAMRAHFSDRELCEAILTIGYYMMVARFLETTGVDLEQGSADTVPEMMKRIQRGLP
jgi:4-carboxymuconolactone decarboxylase